MTTMENSIEDPQKFKIEQPHDPTITPLEIYPKENENSNSKKYLNSHIHRSIIYNSQDIECPLTDKWIKKM